MKKKSKTESGHKTNVSSFEDLIARYITLGPAYNPPRAELQIGSLQQKHLEAQMILHHLADREVWEQDSGNRRAAAFKAIRPLVTRIINTMKACGLSEKSIEDARAIQRRINGRRAGKKTTSEDTATNGEQSESTADEPSENDSISASRNNSTSRQSYDMLIEHFAKLLLLLQREMNYTPNEYELQLSGLQAHEQHLRALLATATTAEAEAESARIQRTDILYDISNGLVTYAQQSKSYVKALFGSTSPQYKQVSSIRFRRIKSK